MKLRHIISLVAIITAFGGGKYYDKIKPAIEKFISGYSSIQEEASTGAIAVTLSKVSDGDSFVAWLDGYDDEQRVRLYGVDAPELNQPYGRNAKEALEDLLRGREISLQIYDIDQYDRKVVVLMADDVNVNLALLESGNTWYYGYHCKEDFCRDWEKAAQKAKSEHKGLWNTPKPVAPWEFRAR
jgi:endonuclease YncB( thermonuclease family)